MIIACATPAWAQSSSATLWNRWEQSLTSAKSYSNAYTDVTVSATYTGPQGQEFTVDGFWDGGSTWKIRTAFSAAGTWNWTTKSSDTSNTGLHNRSGSVNVGTYGGSNSLYQRGFLKVSSNKRYLVYDDGTPFLWMGDSAWVGPLKDSQTNWQTYVNDRIAKRFTVTQVTAGAPGWASNTDINGNAPFTNGDLSRWNPLFGQEFDRRIQYANDKGLVLLVVGLMEPIGRYPASAAAVRFARNIAARLAGNFVIFSPSFDSLYESVGDDVGSALRQASSRHLVTQHVGTSLSAAQSYYDKSYLNFSASQSGHNRGNREACASNAIKWNLSLYERSPFKPVINLETYYDANNTAPAGASGAYLGTAKDARQMGYLSWLSGSLGYTYGALGVWDWETDSSKGSYWTKAIAFPSSTQMKHMSTFFGGIAWWTLAPAHALVQSNPSAYLSKRVVAKSPSGDLAVAYTPDSNPITLSMASFVGAMQARWFNPTTGTFTNIAGTFDNSGTHGFTPPASGDWLLLLTSAATQIAKVSGTATDANASEPSNPGLLTISRSGSLSGDLVVSYQVGGTATPGVDYQALPGTLTLPNGQASATIVIEPIDDEQQENVETIEVTLMGASTYELGTSSMTVTLADDDTEPLCDADAAGDCFYFYAEAETQNISAPAGIGTSNATSGGSYVSSDVAFEGEIGFTFDVPQAGEYIVWARILATSGVADSFFVSANGGAEDVYDLAENAWSEDWQWTRVNGRNGGAPMTLNPRLFSLKSGENTLLFRGREVGAGLDVILITDDTTFVPTDLPCADGTLDNGVCSTGCTPMSEICDDGIDNDCDGDIDSADAQCEADAAVCPENYVVVSSADAELEEFTVVVSDGDGNPVICARVESDLGVAGCSGTDSSGSGLLLFLSGVLALGRALRKN
ncbi:MAG: DUF4038 domain-containing protein [Myxococcota bacterium]